MDLLDEEPLDLRCQYKKAEAKPYKLFIRNSPAPIFNRKKKTPLSSGLCATQFYPSFPCSNWFTLNYYGCYNNQISDDIKREYNAAINTNLGIYKFLPVIPQTLVPKLEFQLPNEYYPKQNDTIKAPQAPPIINGTFLNRNFIKLEETPVEEPLSFCKKDEFQTIFKQKPIFTNGHHQPSGKFENVLVANKSSSENAIVVPLPKKGKSCKYCGKWYESTSAHSMHVRTHEMNCPCTVCGKRFSRTWLLQCHMRTHTGEKPFRCEICDKSFTDKSNFRAHSQTHSGFKPHRCMHCNKGFALRSYLFKHERSCGGSNTPTPTTTINNGFQSPAIAQIPAAFHPEQALLLLENMAQYHPYPNTVKNEFINNQI